MTGGGMSAARALAKGTAAAKKAVTIPLNISLPRLLSSERGPDSEARAAVKANEAFQTTLKGGLIGGSSLSFFLFYAGRGSELTIH
jgi:hypothetical protein